MRSGDAIEEIGPIPWYESTHNGEFEQTTRVPDYVWCAPPQYMRCKFATHTLLDIVRVLVERSKSFNRRYRGEDSCNILTKIVDPHAEVKWFRKTPKQPFMLVKRGDTVSSSTLPKHFTILVTLANDARWIIDPSGAQFGIDPSRIWVGENALWRSIAFLQAR